MDTPPGHWPTSLGRWFGCGSVTACSRCCWYGVGVGGLRPGPMPYEGRLRGCSWGGGRLGIVWFGSRAFKCMEYFGVGGVVGYGLGCGYDWRYGTVWLHGYCRGGGIGFKAVWGR